MESSIALVPKLLLVLLTISGRALTTVITINYNVVENTGADYFIGNIHSSMAGTDYRFADNSTSEYQYLCSKYFTLLSSGELKTRIDIDRESLIETTNVNTDEITCLVNYNNGDSTLSLFLIIQVEDVNDVVPKLFGLDHNISIYENLRIGQIIMYLTPYDLDRGINGTVNYTIIEGNEDEYFELRSPAGSGDSSPDRLLYLKKELNYGLTPSFKLTFRITDKAVNPLQSYQELFIYVIDVNDQTPTFPISVFYFDLPEIHPIGKDYPFGKVNATDEDSAVHAQIFYQLSASSASNYGNLFAVNATTGELYLLQAVDFETKQEYQLSVEARNPESATGTNADITVTVIDHNDEKPLLINEKVPAVQENKLSKQFILTYQDKDASSDNNKIVSVSVAFSPSVNHTMPSISKQFAFYFISFKIEEPLDREQIPVLNCTVLVTDNGTPSQTSETLFTIIVGDENDNAPQFIEKEFTGKVAVVSQPTRSVVTVTAEDPDVGSNASFRFAIDRTKPDAAENWFQINSTTGEIFLVAQPNDTTVGNRVELTVSATDTSNNTNHTVVNISILPSVTFQPNSFQEYSNIDLIGSSVVYLELRTDGGITNNVTAPLLLLYQYSSIKLLSASLQIVNGRIMYSIGNERWERAVDLHQNTWYSILIDKNDMANEIQVWEKGGTSSQTVDLLHTSVFNRCPDQIANSSVPLYVGGVENVFTIPIGTVSSYDFNGEISTVIVDGVQLDMSCPHKQNNVLAGTHFYDKCNSNLATNACNEQYSTCLTYTAEGKQCQCKSGFPQENCDQDEDFGPISLTNGSHIEFDLGYDYFFHSLSNQNQPKDTQTVSISFISSIKPLVGVLFYSRTGNTVQRLEIDQTIRYTVTASDYTQILSLISQRVTILPGVEYTLVLRLQLEGNNHGVIEFGRADEELQQLTLQKNAETSSFEFVKQPNTRISIGGTSDTKLNTVKGNFSGCVTGFSINGAPIPLSSFISTHYKNLTIHGSKDGVSSTCHSCFSGEACSSTNSECKIEGLLEDNLYTCRCVEGVETRPDGTCVEEETASSSSFTSSTSMLPTETSPGQVTDGVEDPNSQGGKLGLNVIIGIAGGTLFVLVILMVLLILVIRFAYVKGKNKHSFQFVTQVTYHGGNQDENNSDQLNNKESVPVTTTRRLNNYVNTPLKHTRCSSSEMDTDSAIDGTVPSQCSYRKSTSQETGFHTASEFDPQTPSRQSSPRRVYDSGKSSSEQFDSDVETDSESLNTSCIEECLSPHDMRLVNPNHIAVGMNHLQYRKKHSSRERIPFGPPLSLRPPSNSYMLTEDETESEVSTTTNTTNRHLGNDDDSIISDPNGPKWYKSSSPSTIVSTDVPIQHSPHYHSHTLDSYKRSKRRTPPATFRPHKSSSPPHYYINHNGHPPPSTSPLVQKTHRFDYSSPYSPGSNRVFQYENVEPVAGARLPAIDESGQYTTHHLPSHYHVRQHSDHSYLDGGMLPPPVPMPSHHHPQMHVSYDPAPYYPGYQGTNLTPGGGTGSTKYCDLNSFAQVNPITYWEQQQRLRPTVDDGLNFLNEPYTKFEDVSTTPSVVESTVVDGDDESVLTASEYHGGVRRPVTSRGIHNDYYTHQMQMPVLSKMPRSRRNSEREDSPATKDDLNDSTQEEDEEKTDNMLHPITHFPSADCCTPTFINSSHRDGSGMLDSTSTLAADTNE